MRVIGGILLYLLTFVFALTLIGACIDAAAGRGAGAFVAVQFLVTAGFGWWAYRTLPFGRGSGARRGSDQVAEVRALARQVDEAGAFPPVDTGTLMMRAGETALLAESSAMLEQAQATSRRYAGTRVRIGGVPLYVGGSEPITRQYLRQAATGRLVLTNRALLFQGDNRTATIALGEMMACDPSHRDAVTVSVHGRAKPYLFIVRNPVLWSCLCRFAARVPLQDGRLPAGTRLLDDEGAGRDAVAT